MAGSPRAQLLWMALLSEAVFLGGAVVLGHWWEIQWWRELPSALGLVCGGLLGGVLALVPFAVVHSRSAWLGELRLNFKNVLVLFRSISRPRDFLLIGALAGIGEEALLRGAVQGGLKSQLGIGPALLGSTLLFGLLHPLSRSYVVYTCVLGLVLGGLREWTGEVYSAMLAHAVFDAVALALGAGFLKRLESSAP